MDITLIKYLCFAVWPLATLSIPLSLTSRFATPRLANASQAKKPNTQKRHCLRPPTPSPIQVPARPQSSSNVGPVAKRVRKRYLWQVLWTYPAWPQRATQTHSTWWAANSSQTKNQTAAVSHGPSCSVAQKMFCVVMSTQRSSWEVETRK